MSLTQLQVANIIFNETRSLSGISIQEARKNVAHAIINADNTLGNKRPITAPTTVTVPLAEKSVYLQCQEAATQAMNDTKDPTDGAIYFNFRKNNGRGDFYGAKIKTQVGPLNNSYPTVELPAKDIYANTYGN
jgi:hypothetical protein